MRGLGSLLRRRRLLGGAVGQFGEKLGRYRDFPVSTVRTSPFAPVWIAETVRRQG